MKKTMKNITRMAVAVFLIMLLICARQQPAYAKSGNTTGNIIPRGSLTNGCRYGKSIYYDYGSALYRFNTVSRKSTLIKKFNGICLNSINVYNGKIYLAVEDMTGFGYDSDIYSLNTNGKGLKKLAKGKCCMVENDVIYYLQMKNCKVTGIGRMKLDGTGKKKLKDLSGADYVTSLFVYKNRIYFDQFTKSYSSIYSIKNNGSDYKLEAEKCYALGCENGYLYYKKILSYNPEYSVCRKQLSTQKTETILEKVRDAAVSGNTVYYTVKETNNELGKSTIYIKNVKTGKSSKIVSGNGYSDIRIYGDWLYLIKDINDTDKNGHWYNKQGVFMTTKGKNKTGLEKACITNG